MNRSERKIRNKSFLALLLAVAMFFANGMQVFAANYSITYGFDSVAVDSAVKVGTIIFAGDSVSHNKASWADNRDDGDNGNHLFYKNDNDSNIYTPDTGITVGGFTAQAYPDSSYYGWLINTIGIVGSGNDISTKKIVLKPKLKNTITYVLDGGTVNGNNPGWHCEVNNVDKLYDDNNNLIREIISPTKKGYTFTGWVCQDVNGDNVQFNLDANGTIPNEGIWNQDITLTAQWNKNNYAINFNENGGSVAKDAQLFTIDNANDKVNTEYTGTKANHRFKEWNTMQDGSGESITADTLLTDMIDKMPANADAGAVISMTLYAQWAPIYTVKFNKNGGTGDDMENQLFEIGEEKALSANTYTYEGKTFAGWVENATDTVAKYADGATVKDLTETAGATVELYALWTETDENQQFTISFNPGGGLGRMDDITVDAGADVVLPANTFTWDSFVFAAWMGDDNKTYADKAKIENVNRNMTLTAMWREDDSKNNAGNNKDPKDGKTFRIYYSLPMGAVNPPENPRGYSPGEEINHFADPYMTGYAFIGWYKDSKFTEPVTSIRKTDAGDLVLYARFAKNPLTIGFVDGLETDIYSPTEGEAFKEIGDRLPAAGFSIKKGEAITFPGTEYNTAEEEIVYVSSKGVVYWAGEQYTYLMAVEDADENGYVEMKAFVIPVAVGDDKAEVTKVKQVGKHAAKVTWKITDPSSVDGYLLYYKSDKKGSSWKCEVVDSKTRLNAKVKKLKGSDTWYFKVAAYKKVKTADGGWHLDISETGSAKKVTLK